MKRGNARLQHFLAETRMEKAKYELNWLLHPHSGDDLAFAEVAEVAAEIFRSKDFSRDTTDDAFMGAKLAVKVMQKIMASPEGDKVVYRSRNGAVELHMTNYLPDVCATILVHYKAMCRAYGPMCEQYLRVGHSIEQDLFEKIAAFEDSFAD